MKFQERLRKAQKDGDMTMADMARWFDVPFQSARYWLIVGDADMEPRGPRARMIRKRLERLEWAIHHSIGFPVPQMLRVRDRKQHIETTRDAIDHAGVPAGDPP